MYMKTGPGGRSPARGPTARTWSGGGAGRPRSRGRGEGSAAYARAPAAGQRAHFLARRHRGVARRGHRERTVGRTELEALLERLSLEQAVDEAGGEAVAAADPVEDPQVVARGGGEHSR